jgi:transcriptional regulator with XRE-family HTH domain
MMTKAGVLKMLIARRKKIGLSVYAAAKLSTLTQPAWSRVENGLRVPQWDTLFAMAVALDMTPAVSFEPNDD